MLLTQKETIISTKPLIMKKLFVLFTLAVFVFTSCQKDEALEQNIDDNWEEGPQDDWSDEDDSDGYDDDDSSDQHDHAGFEGGITLYKVDGGNISKIKDFNVPDDLISYQVNEKLHIDIWEFVTKLIPVKYFGKVSQFELFYGDGDILGYVTPEDGRSLDKWKFALAIDEAKGIESIDLSNEFTYVVLHEYGHVLTLNDDQVDVDTSEDSCNNYHTGEGCSNADSYINRIVDIGWTDILNQNMTDSYEIYQQYPDRFLSEYAATNPGEDIAEVFTGFVIQENKPSGNSISDQKIKAFYDFPELVKLRTEIRSSITPARLKSLNMDEYKSILSKLVKGHKH